MSDCDSVVERLTVMMEGIDTTFCTISIMLEPFVTAACAHFKAICGPCAIGVRQRLKFAK